MVSQRNTLVPLPRSNLLLLHRSLLPLSLAIPRKSVERHRPRRSRAHHPAACAWCRRDLAHFPRPGRFLVDDLGMAGLAERACWVEGVEGDHEIGQVEGAVWRGCSLARFLLLEGLTGKRVWAYRNNKAIPKEPLACWQYPAILGCTGAPQDLVIYHGAPG